MLERVIQCDRLQELDERVNRARQSLFEVRGGEGSVKDFVEQGSVDERWELMSADEQELWLDVVSIRTTPEQEQKVVKG